ncbi:MAG TPA: glycogen debranching protein GlgX [Candidatus Limnocylindria bacterium]|nr:glycogen debranching protein GlgX [Candidatus Limnocylindria bacterium]
MRAWPGRPYPLGATWDGNGTNFVLFSEVATRVELCLFDDHGNEQRVDLPEVTAYCWHGYLPAIRPGQRYGYRVHGPFDPSRGLRCQPAKLLLDPYARAIEGQVRFGQEVFAYRLGGQDDLEPDTTDSAPAMPKSVVVDDSYDWDGDRRPEVPWHRTVIYETHVKGLTMRHPGVPEELRGTYGALAERPVIEHLRTLGVTAVELLPVHQFVHDGHLLERGLRNYWGYNTIGYFAPHNEYACGGGRGAQVREFKDMVKGLHAAGLEVILDVVYNHTAEGNHLGPTLSFRGIDDQAYYRHTGDPRYYMDYTGTGNSLNMRHPHVLQLIMDSLRYWVNEMHVDGFRFDLAATLARELHDVDRLSSFFDLIQQDPVLRGVKLIAEPWDVGDGGYQVGNFPPLWSEWNGTYRDSVRDLWRGAEQAVPEFAARLTGSSDLYESSGRRPYNSVNFVTAHDGFTLRDLVSYDRKHNEANGDEGGGEDNNRSWGHGAEGPTDDPGVNALRARQQRNFIATLALSQGVPMLLGGDEIGRTQHGNNNAYCQDNELSWYDWEHVDAALAAFTRKVLALRREHPVFQRRRWFQGRPIRGSGVRDIAWFDLTGREMADETWNVGFARSLSLFLNGRAIAGLSERGHPIVDDSFLLLFNAHHEPLPFHAPPQQWTARWNAVIDTARPDGAGQGSIEAGGEWVVEGRSLVVMRSAA